MPKENAAARCVFPNCNIVFTDEIEYEGIDNATVFDPNSRLIKRASVHHLKYRTGHSIFALFATRDEAKNAQITEPSISATTDPLQAYYDKFSNIKGHIVVTRNRDVIGGQIKG